MAHVQFCFEVILANAHVGVLTRQRRRVSGVFHSTRWCTRWRCAHVVPGYLGTYFLKFGSRYWGVVISTHSALVSPLVSLYG